MPVEIRKLVITVKVEEPTDNSVNTSIDTNAIIEACVKQVLRILRKTKAR